MRQLILYSIVCLFLVAPQLSHAKTVESWNFMNNQVPGKWNVKGLQPIPSPNGLLVQAPESGFISRESEVDFGVDTVSIQYSIPFSTEAKLLFSHPDHESALLELPFVIDKAPAGNEMKIPVSTYNEWQRHMGTIGFVFPKGVEITIHEISFMGYNPIEKGIEIVKSFWTFDNFRGTTVNFLWGPQINVTPIARTIMFLHLPPRSDSGMSLIYLALFAVCTYVFIRSKTNKPLSNAYKIVAVTFVTLWLLLDVRMGLEIVSYTVDDIGSYWTQEQGTRTLRVRGHFNDFAEQITPLITEERYGFISRLERPYIMLMRYMTYPALPIWGGPDQLDLNTWVIYDRPDITLNQNNELTLDGAIISKPGRMVKQYEPGTFLFTSNE